MTSLTSDAKETRRPWRLALGLGDSEREHAWIPALHEGGDFTIVERALAAEHLLACVRQGRADVALVAFDLHRLTSGVLAELTRSRVPLVVLTPDPDEEPWRDLDAMVLPLETGADVLQQALMVAARGERPPVAPDEPETPAETRSAPRDPTVRPAVLTLTSGHGSPGRTTIAISLATALGAVAPTVLVDADMNGPTIAACLDANPTRNLYMLAHAEPLTTREWDHAIDQETQPLSPRSPHGVVLCGVPKAEMRAKLAPQFFERLLAELRRRYQYVIVDVGADFLGADVGLHRLAISLADEILMVITTDLVGLWHGRAALRHLDDHLDINPARAALVLNQYDRRHHHSRTEIEWVLGAPTAAVIPYDRGAVQQAVRLQQPLVLQRGSPAGRAILDLAERVHKGQIKLPPEPKGQRRVPWLRWPQGLRLGGSRPTAASVEMTGGVQHDEHGFGRQRPHG
ncbi:MAG: hypothetical protein KIS91_14100 [Anaerolineae bacterium]|nr:hypothetical protein [Anaerolineae bacterium]